MSEHAHPPIGHACLPACLREALTQACAQARPGLALPPLSLLIAGGVRPPDQKSEMSRPKTRALSQSNRISTRLRNDTCREGRNA